MSLPNGPLPGAITDQVEARLKELYRIAWEHVGARGKEPREVRAWDLARGLFRRELDEAENVARAFAFGCVERCSEDGK